TCKMSQATASFLFATEDGTIVGWNTNLYPTEDLCANGGAQSTYGIIAANQSSGGAIYKGLEISTDPPALYATDFHNGRVDIYGPDFSLLHNSAFIDPKLPHRYAPFNIKLFGDRFFCDLCRARQGQGGRCSGRGPWNS